MLFIFSCASLTPPNGGPDDKTGPEVLTSTPAFDAINVSKDTRISFTFSEWISTKPVKCISIFPPVAFKHKLYNNKLDIFPLTKLRDSTTYHVLITSSLLDLHGNPITPLNLIFSTGPALDSGYIRGCIIDSSTKSSQYRLALFSEKDLADSGVFGTPSYLLQTDTSGTFDFKHIKVNTYQPIAYVDKNNDAHLQSGTEAVFTTEDSLIFIDKETPQIMFFPALFDTSFPQITGLKAINEKIISAAWSRTYDSLVFNAPKIMIERADTTDKLLNVKYLPLNNSLTFALSTNLPLKIAPYRVVYSSTRIFDSKIFTDTVLFNGTNIADSINPGLHIKPDTNSVTDLTTPIRLIWTEPVTITKPLYVINSAGDSIQMSISAGHSDTSVITPFSRLSPGTIYKLIFTKDFARDLYGNTILMKDSSDTLDTLWIRTVNPDSIATSLQGGSSCLKHSDSRIWVYAPWGLSQRKHYTKDSSGIFRFDSIAASKGQIGYFIDKNDNRVPDKGRLYPWHSPEPYLMSTDTVEARARWDIEGVNVNICEPCKKSEPDIKSISDLKKIEDNK